MYFFKSPKPQNDNGIRYRKKPFEKKKKKENRSSFNSYFATSLLNFIIINNHIISNIYYGLEHHITLEFYL